MGSAAKSDDAACPAVVRELVARFAEHLEAYRRQTYNEAQVRREFIDPFFETLGWDVHNKAGHAEAYKDVIHEDAIKVGGATKAPDYCFRVGGVRKFFVEAKKPSTVVKDDPGPAYQLRRYAWTNKLPLSIVTDFEEFAVYDCRIKPQPTDKPAAARVLYVTYDEYAARWADIAAIFGKDAILKGSFDKYAESNRRKRGTAEVDKEFLKEIEGWRELLARNIALRNPGLSVRELNYAVGKTIDRIIFLRMCEDRGIETYAQLRILLNGTGVYKRLVEIFYRADERYNSGLFYFRAERGRPDAPDELTPGLDIDDRVLKDIIAGLYYPECPYEFSVLPADILGHVYEQFLGKVIRLTKGHRAVVEEKPEVRKAGGVYYTPTYIVDYIVEHTVDKLLEGRGIRWIGRERNKTVNRPRMDGTLRVLDPACGSGSFLLGAYERLLRWYLDYYGANNPQDWARRPAPPIVQAPAREGGDRGWRLSIAERKRVLLEHIYGVDIDPQAVEVTKLSLLLKVLEGESQQTLDHQLRFFHERALPDLGANIKCGNSLIGPDFYENQQMNLFDEEERYRINAFDWYAEFPEVMGPRPDPRSPAPDPQHGFDAVIGNPPWGQKEIEKVEKVNEYLRESYTSLRGIFDLFRPFVDRGISLNKGGGWFGMILPDIVLLKDYADTRRRILEGLTIDRIDWWGMAFPRAVIDAATITGCKTAAPAQHVVTAVVHEEHRAFVNPIPQADFWRNERLTLNLFLTYEKRQILESLQACPRLGDWFAVHEGAHSGNIRDELFVPRRMDTSCRELLFGRDEIVPYVLTWKGRYIRMAALPSKRTRSRYANAGQPEWHDRQKVLVRRTGDYVLAAVDLERRYASNNFFLVFPIAPSGLDLFGLCALLNSRLITWYFRTIEPRVGRVFAELKIKHLTTFPLPPGAQKTDGSRTLNELGSRRWDAGRRLHAARTPHDKQVLARKCKLLDEQIDDLVLASYGLSEDQRRLILEEAPDEKGEETAA